LKEDKQKQINEVLQIHENNLKHLVTCPSNNKRAEDHISKMFSEEKRILDLGVRKLKVYKEICTVRSFIICTVFGLRVIRLNRTRWVGHVAYIRSLINE
jgi:hypothetical protein